MFAGHLGAFGDVLFQGETNVQGLNLDEIVIFEDQSVTVYPNESQKPPLNSELNKPARIRLLSWPRDKRTRKAVSGVTLMP